MDRADTQFKLDKIINDKTSDLMAECIQNFKTTRCNNPRVNLDFNSHVKSFPMDKFPKVPLAMFEITGGVFSKEERKKCSTAKFTRLYLGDPNVGRMVESFFVALPPIILGTLLSIF